MLNEKYIMLISIMIFCIFIYYIKRKFDSIDKYNALVSDKLNTYRENLKQYKKNLEDSGITNNETDKIIIKIIKFIKKIRGSG